jgi:hypothetical protein
MALQLYSQCEVFANGSKLAEEASVTIDRRTNAQVVNTVAKGFAGESPGAAHIQIKVTNAVPAAAFEVNPGQFMGLKSGSALQVVEFTFYAAGLTLTTKGFVDTDNFAHAVNSEAKLEFAATCEPADWR